MQIKRLVAGICAGAVALFVTGCTVDADPDAPGSTTVIKEDNPVAVPVPGPSTHTETQTTVPASPGAPSTSTTTTTGG